MPGAISVRTNGGRAFLPGGELDAIIAATEAAAPDGVEVTKEPGLEYRHRPPDVPAEILEVVWPLARDYLFARFADAIVGAVRRGYQERYKDNSHPRYVDFYGPDGSVIKRVAIHDETDD
jgi:hypothetical protein